MNNTDKLLRAFIEASGYEIKETREDIASGGSNSMGSWHKVESVVIDYKVTKREDVALSLLREIVKGDHDYDNEYHLGVDLFKRIKELTNV